MNNLTYITIAKPKILQLSHFLSFIVVFKNIWSVKVPLDVDKRELYYALKRIFLLILYK